MGGQSRQGAQLDVGVKRRVRQGLNVKTKEDLADGFANRRDAVAWRQVVRGEVKRQRKIGWRAHPSSYGSNREPRLTHKGSMMINMGGTHAPSLPANGSRESAVR